MRKLTYLVVFETDENQGISLYFPDVPGCISYGNNFDHALHMAKDALALHIYSMEKDGEATPARTDKIPKTDAGEMVVPVTIYPDVIKDELNNRRVKTTVTIPHWLKSIAETEGVNYSRLLENALKETLGFVSCFSPVSSQRQTEPEHDM
jgi:predicted RNase H-like HicB family nuclease